MTIRVGVTGSRFAQAIAHARVIRELIEDALPIAAIVHGGANGVDRIAATVAAELGLAIEAHPADWARHGRAAGPRRNAEMVASGIDLWLAFPMAGAENAGTWDCVRRAANAGAHIWVTPLQPVSRKEKR